MKEYFVLAFKNLKKRGIRSWLTLIGILIGIAAVISLISLGTALQDTIISQFPIESKDIITVQPGGLNQFGPVGTAGSELLKQGDVYAIEKLGRVEVAFGRKIGNIDVEFNNIQNSLIVASSPVGEKRKYLYEFFELKIQEGRFLRDDDTNGIILGNNYLDAEKNGFGKSIKAGDRIKINNESFKVIGILEKKGSFIFDRGILINHNSLDSLLNFGEDIDLIVVKVRNKNEIQETKEDIENLMRQRRSVKTGEENFEVSTPEATLSTINEILLGVQIFIIIIASISILIGAIGIANTMATSVLERKKEIGIMKSIGAKNQDIFYQFFVEAGLLGFVGGLLGIILGLGISYLAIYSIKQFLGISTSITLNYFLILFSLIGSFIIGSLSGIIPALNAAKQHPVEALRN